jgi:hypothetical protein
VTYQEYKTLIGLPLFRAFRRIVRQKVQDMRQIPEQGGLMHGDGTIGERAAHMTGFLQGLRWSIEGDLAAEVWPDELAQDEEAQQS